MLPVQGGGRSASLPALTPSDLFTDINHHLHSSPDIPPSELVFDTDPSGRKSLFRSNRKLFWNRASLKAKDVWVAVCVDKLGIFRIYWCSQKLHFNNGSAKKQANKLIPKHLSAQKRQIPTSNDVQLLRWLVILGRRKESLCVCEQKSVADCECWKKKSSLFRAMLCKVTALKIQPVRRINRISDINKRLAWRRVIWLHHDPGDLFSLSLSLSPSSHTHTPSKAAMLCNILILGARQTQPQCFSFVSFMHHLWELKRNSNVISLNQDE